MHIPTLVQVPIWCAGERSFRVETPIGAALRLEAGPRHPVLGDADLIVDGSGRPLTAVGRLDWRRPTHIPPMVEPGRLPAGGGTALLNVIAENAAGPLRYRGPYPSAALWRSLSACFRVEPGGEEAFIAAGEGAALRGEHVEPAAAFAPAPFVRRRRGRVCLQERDEEIEAIHIDGRDYGRGEGDGRRLLEAGGALVAALVVGGRPAREVGRFDRDGEITEALADAPEPGGPERPLPPAVAGALWAAIAAAAPPLLRPAIAAMSRDTALAWGDPGLALAAPAAGGRALVVHAAYAAADLAPEALLLALARALGPPAWRLAQARLAAMVDI